MVNGWLRSPNLAVDIAPGRRYARIFATKAALTSASRGGAGVQKSFWIKRFLVY